MKEKRIVPNAVYKLHNEQLEKYSNEHHKCLDAKRININSKYNPINLNLSKHKLEEMFATEDEDKDENEKPAGALPMPKREDEEEKKEGKGLKILTPNEYKTFLNVEKRNIE